MTFTAAAGGRDESTRRAIDILDSVCRRVHGKDAVSHVFLRLFARSSTIQLVFPHGSLRLQLPVAAAPAGLPVGVLKPLDVLCAFPALFARTEELRIHYDDDGVAPALAASLPAAFPCAKTVALVRDFDWDRQTQWPPPPDSAPPLQDGLRHLVPPSPDDIPYPALDTLWVSLERADEIADLEAVLAARASVGIPIRRVIVTVFPPTRADAGSDVPTRLRGLNAEEVIVMEIEEGTAGGSSGLREVDWMVRLPERFSLPPAIHRDWPVIWYGRK